MHFIQGINHDPVKLQFVRSIHEIADKSGCQVIAEGIETQAELLVIRGSESVPSTTILPMASSSRKTASTKASEQDMT